MLIINYKGYEISQADNNHIMICKDNQMLFHTHCNRKLSKKQLQEQFNFYEKILGILEGGDRNE